MKTIMVESWPDAKLSVPWVEGVKVGDHVRLVPMNVPPGKFTFTYEVFSISKAGDKPMMELINQQGSVG